jgi:PqqD family protein of HPr-rel-A system
LITHPAGEQPSTTTRWRTCREFRSKAWQDGVVIYDTASGDTHHLTPTAFQILNLLHNAPHTQEELARCVLSSDVNTVGDESLAMLDATLAHLAQLGLIESIKH